MMINNENKKSFARMMKSRAVYVALGVCVLAAGFVSYSVSKVSNVPQTGVIATEAERSIYVHINERILPGDPQKKIHMMMSYCGLSRDVADPWYTGDFETTFQDILSACEAMLTLR